MAKYINAEKFEREMYHEAFETDSDMQKWDSGCWIRYKMFENCIVQQPAADVVEVIHGEWIKADSMPRSAKCSECNCWITRHTINENWFRYCPHCGAKMDGKKVE